LCVAGAVPIPGLPRATWRGIRKCDVQRGAGISRIGGQNLWVVIIDGVSAVEPDSVIVRNGNPHRSVGSASRHERVTASVRETQTRVGITIAGSAGILLFSLLAAICRALASPREPDCDPGRYRVGCREHAMEDLVNRDTDAVPVRIGQAQLLGTARNCQCGMDGWRCHLGGSRDLGGFRG